MRLSWPCREKCQYLFGLVIACLIFPWMFEPASCWALHHLRLQHQRFPSRWGERPWGASNQSKCSITRHQKSCVVISLCWYSDTEMFSPLSESAHGSVWAVNHLLFLCAAGYSLPGFPERWHHQAWLAVQRQHKQCHQRHHEGEKHSEGFVKPKSATTIDARIWMTSFLKLWYFWKGW